MAATATRSRSTACCAARSTRPGSSSATTPGARPSSSTATSTPAARCPASRPRSPATATATRPAARPSWSGTDGFDFLLFSLPDNDNYSHRHGPEASVESIAKADHCFGKLRRGGGGLDALPRRARADPARRPRPDRRSTAACRWPSCSAASGRSCSPPTSAPSWPSWRSARPAAPPTSTCCRGRASGPSPTAVRRALAEIEGVDLVCRLEDADGEPLRREEPGMPAGRRWAVVERGGEALRFRPGERASPTCAAARWELEGEPRGAGGRRSTDGRLRSEELPGPAGPGLVGADRPARRRLHRLAGARLRGGRLGRRHPRRRRQPRRPARRRLARPAALRRLRPRVRGRAGPVDAARRRPGGSASTSG